jgi:hypothetical protein
MARITRMKRTKGVRKNGSETNFTNHHESNKVRFCAVLPNRIRSGPAGPILRLLSIHIIQENVLTPITPMHHVVNGTWIFDSELAWHIASDEFAM